MTVSVRSVVLLSVLIVGASGQSRAGDEATARAVAYLVQEVPAWNRENRCYSCHNNGDGARALMAAAKAGYEVPDDALASTRNWLVTPDGWDKNGGEGEFNDQRLAWLQFGTALATQVALAEAEGDPRSTEALLSAARRIADMQSSDGSWTIQDGGLIGSPVTWGPVLSTVLARRTLRTADANRFAAHIARADEWLRSSEPQSVLDAAAVLAALNETDDPRDARLTEHCLTLLQKSQSTAGGWGPYPISPPETFDTAMVLLALKSSKSAPEIEAMIAAGRSFLIKSQQPNGSWRETTRPPGAESYAQHISTTAWGTLALLATE